ncbi:MAG TPA: type II toxin-antitoxin system HicB family antitoxin [Rhizomicrobium sp.]|nr:type II toxin-antitoxin system HicB family antitoxin [Rhizomicrobium sp.]
MAQMVVGRRHRHGANAVIVMVPLDIPGKSLRVNISIDENLVDAIDRAAKAAGQNRSSYLADAARAPLLRGVCAG